MVSQSEVYEEGLRGPKQNQNERMILLYLILFHISWGWKFHKCVIIFVFDSAKSYHKGVAMIKSYTVLFQSDFCI